MRIAESCVMHCRRRRSVARAMHSRCERARSAREVLLQGECGECGECGAELGLWPWLWPWVAVAVACVMYEPGWRRVKYMCNGCSGD